MKGMPSCKTVLISLAVTTVLAGCAHTEPSRFYALSSSHQGKRGGRSVSGPTVRIARVRVARYLDRDQIVSRPGENELAVSEFDRWAEPLGEGISRVLVENLSAMLPSDRVFSYAAGAAGPVDFQVLVSVTAFEVDRMHTLLLRAGWQVVSGDGKTVIADRRSDLRQSITGSGVGRVVAAHSRALEELSQEIANAITSSSVEAQRSGGTR
jgi:uncharacterized lipoprotein YmbA